MNLAGMVESHFYLINDQKSKIDTSSVKFFFKKLKILTVPATEKLRTVIQTFISGRDLGVINQIPTLFRISF